MPKSERDEQGDECAAGTRIGSTRRTSRHPIQHLARRATLLIALALGLVLAACDYDDDSSDGNGGSGESESQAEANLCDDVDALRSSVGDLTSIDPESATLNEIKDAGSEVRDDLEAATDSAQAVASDRSGEIDQAIDDLRTAVDDLDEDQTLREMLNQIKPELQSLGDAFQGFVDTDSCTESDQGTR